MSLEGQSKYSESRGLHVHAWVGFVYESFEAFACCRVPYAAEQNR